MRVCYPDQVYVPVASHTPCYVAHVLHSAPYATTCLHLVQHLQSMPWQQLYQQQQPLQQRDDVLWRYEHRHCLSGCGAAQTSLPMACMSFERGGCAQCQHMCVTPCLQVWMRISTCTLGASIAVASQVCVRALYVCLVCALCVMCV